MNWVKKITGKKPSPHKDSERSYLQSEAIDSELITEHERTLLSNILKLRDLSVVQVMVPRGDIFAVDIETTQEDLLNLLAERQFSRIAVYKNTLDDLLGTVHIKDIMAALARAKPIDLQGMVRDVPIVSPSLNILDLLLIMRKNRRHIAFVVDEYGGIDGLVTINDVIEAMIGEVYDEHDADESPKIARRDDGGADVDARIGLHEFEAAFGPVFTEEDRETSDTLAGLVYALAGHIPARGEVINHESGMVFEVLDADPRRIKFLRIRGVPPQTGASA